MRILAKLIAGWFALYGLITLSIGAWALYEGTSEQPSHGCGIGQLGESIALFGMVLVGGLSGLPHLFVGSLFLFWKKFPASAVGVICVLDAAFWLIVGAGFFCANQGGHESFFGSSVALALMGGHLAAALLFFHPGSRSRPGKK